MYLINVPSKQLINCPPLRVFLQIFPSQYNLGSDTEILMIEDETMTMVHVWKKFTHNEREQICTCLNVGRKHKNVHQGVLALLPIVSVVEELSRWNNLYPTLNEVVRATLKNRTGELAAKMMKNNALLSRMMKRHAK